MSVFVYPTAESRSDVGQVPENRSFYRKYFYFEKIQMRNFTPLAAIQRKKIVILIILKFKNEFQKDGSTVHGVSHKPKKEVTDPGSNPLPLDRVAKVLSNCATKFAGPLSSVLIYKRNGDLFVYCSKTQTNTDILMKNA